MSRLSVIAVLVVGLLGSNGCSAQSQSSSNLPAEHRIGGVHVSFLWGPEDKPSDNGQGGRAPISEVYVDGHYVGHMF
jgi:hypothetical protein